MFLHWNKAIPTQNRAKFFRKLIIFEEIRIGSCYDLYI